MRDKKLQLQLDKDLQETHHDFQAQESGLEYGWSYKTMKFFYNEMISLLVLGKFFLMVLLTLRREEKITDQSGDGSLTCGVLSLKRHERYIEFF